LKGWRQSLDKFEIKDIYQDCSDTELLKELALELAGYPVCPLCSRLQWRHKPGCMMPEVYRRFGIEPKEEDYE
jgi:hypothetical protein